MSVATGVHGLELRPLEPGDARELFDLVQRNSEHLTALGDYAEVVALDEADTRQQLADLPDSSRVMGIRLAGRLIGRVDLHSPRPRTFVLGYWIDESHCGRGYAKAACRTLIDHVLDRGEASEIWAGVKASNLASVAVLEALGFECVEELPTHRRFRLVREGEMLVRHDANLWSTEHELAWQGGWVPIPVRMTVIRLDDGRLVLHSPVPLAPALRDELDALGPVGFIVVPEAHGRFAEAAARSYPSAQLWAAPRLPRRRRSLAVAGSLGDRPPPDWAGQLESHRVLGFRLNEVVLFHRPSRTLLLTDLCFNIRRGSTRLARAFFRANGMWRHFGPSRLIRRLAVSDRGALEQSLERILEWDFERIVPGHGDVIERGGPAALRAAWPR